MKLRKIVKYANPISPILDLPVKTFKDEDDIDTYPRFVFGIMALASYALSAYSINMNLFDQDYLRAAASTTLIGVGYLSSWQSHTCVTDPYEF